MKNGECEMRVNVEDSGRKQCENEFQRRRNSGNEGQLPKNLEEVQIPRSDDSLGAVFDA